MFGFIDFFKDRIDEVVVQFGGQKETRFNQVVILAGGAGCHSKGTEVLMYDGTYKSVENIKINDLLMGIDSNPRTVTQLHSGTEKMIEVKSNKNDLYICNYNHIHTFIASYSKNGLIGGQLYDMTFDEYQQLTPTKQKVLKLTKNKAIEFQTDKYSLNINPWLIGFWLGDGTRKTSQFTIQSNSPLIDYIKETYESDIYQFNSLKKTKPNCQQFSLTTKNQQNNPFYDYVRKYCEVDNEKRIPQELLLSSIENRKNILAGLIDSDGHYNSGYYEILTKWESLKNDIEFLCGSLGYRVKTTIKKVKWNDEIREYHRINISGNFNDLPIKLEYKQAKQTKNKNPLRMGFKFTILDEGEYFGFSLKEPDKHFILKNWIIQHNSGKGFILDKLIDIEGIHFDVDALKKLAMKSDLIWNNQKIKDMNLNLKHEEDVKKLHAIVSDLGLEKGLKDAKSKSILMAHPQRKPNLIFDVTLKDVTKLKKISDMVLSLGYPKENLHIVWIMNDIDVAIRQNRERDRVVPEDILMDTHVGVANVMKGIMSGFNQVRTYMDGYIVIVPNMANVDNKLKASGFIAPRDTKIKLQTKSRMKHGGLFFQKGSSYYTVKEKGKAIVPFKELSDVLLAKIRSYVPKHTTWGVPDEDEEDLATTHPKFKKARKK